MKHNLMDYEKWRKKALKNPAVRKAVETPDDDPFIDVALQIIRLREKNNMTQSDLARKIRTSQQAVARLESLNHRGFRMETLEKIAGAFHKRLTVQFV